MNAPKVEFREAGEAFERDPPAFAAALTAALHASGERSIVICAHDAAQAGRIDACLWELDASVFMPHALVNDPDAAVAPILIAHPDQPVVHRRLVINLCEQIVAFDCDRIIELIPASASGKQAARERWRAYRVRGAEPVKIESSRA